MDLLLLRRRLLQSGLRLALSVTFPCRHVIVLRTTSNRVISSYPYFLTASSRKLAVSFYSLRERRGR